VNLAIEPRRLRPEWSGLQKKSIRFLSGDALVGARIQQIKRKIEVKIKRKFKRSLPPPSAWRERLRRAPSF
jgi:hypothetical protein